MSPLTMLSILLAAATLPHQDLQREQEVRVISTRVWHLGDNSTPDWSEAPAEAEGGRVELEFEAQAFEGDGLLACRHGHVDDSWYLEINGTRIATLDKQQGYGEHFYSIPSGVIVDGKNSLVLSGDVPTDDITFGDLRYYPFGLRVLHDLRKVTAHVFDGAGNALPARVTIIDERGGLARLYFAERLHTAVREGVVYTADGEASFELPPGDYTIHAARGTEWSIDSATLSISGEQHDVRLELRRELDTTGFVAADTHIHTLTHSGHGDSSVEERMVTLAGEGVELAIATDHNHNTDYRPMQESMGLNAYFTPVVGNEVTTPIGHFNAFPLRTEDPVPPHDLHDVVKIVEGIRARGAKAVILNHPRWPDHERGPHGVHQLDHHSGDWVGEWACPFDAVELINSQTEELEPRLLFQDWFALLNRGERVFAVGSSDSHTVGGVVGQGRTYVESSTDDAANIDADEAAHNIAHGHSSISMGIFADLRNAGGSVMGETISPRALELRVSAPSWVRVRKLTIFANGTPIHTQALAPTLHGATLDRTFELPLTLDWPGHDYWMVALVEGDGVGGKFWPQINDYTLAATNPVFVDMDGNGSYSDPRALATQLLESGGTQPDFIAMLLGTVDDAVAVQLLRLTKVAYEAQARRAIEELAAGAAAKHPNLIEWLDDE